MFQFAAFGCFLLTVVAIVAVLIGMRPVKCSEPKSVRRPDGYPRPTTVPACRQFLFDHGARINARCVSGKETDIRIDIADGYQLYHAGCRLSLAPQGNPADFGDMAEIKLVPIIQALWDSMYTSGGPPSRDQP